MCRAIRRGRFARWLNDLGTAHRSLRFLIINLNVPNSILLRVFSRFPFWLFVRDHRDHSRLFIFETGNIYFFHKRFHTRLLNKMFFFPVYFCLTIFSYYFLFRVNHYVGLKSNWFNDRWRYNKEDYINVIKEIIRGRKLECD